MKTLYFLILMLYALPVKAQQTVFTGKVIEIDQNKTLRLISDASVSFYSQDSTLLGGTTTDEKGHFRMEGLPAAPHHVNISFLGYQPILLFLPADPGKPNLGKKEINLGEISLFPLSRSLGEVTITADNVIRKMDRKLIYPSPAQIDRSADGIELLRTLQLNGIEVKRSDNTVEGIRGGAVRLQINGVTASSKEISGISPADILRIEHIDEPSLRYEQSEAVINFIVKRRESGGSVLVSANHALTTRWGEDYAQVKLNHKKSEFRFAYALSYKKTKSYQDSQENFDLGETTVSRTEEGLWGLYAAQTHDLRANYSLLETDRYLFSTTFTYNKSRTPDNRRESRLYPTGHREEATRKTDQHTAQIQTPAVNFYFQQNLSENQLLLIDLTGTYIQTEQNRTYQETKSEQNIADIYSSITGNKYSVIGEAAYETHFQGGRLSTGVKQTFSHTDNAYRGTETSSTRMDRIYTRFYAEWFGRVKSKITYSIGLGGAYSQMKQRPHQVKKWLFTPTLRLGYQPNSRTEIRYQGRMMEQAPALGDMNDVEQAIDTLQIRKGNPGLLPFASYVNSLTLSSSAGAFRFYLDCSDHYSVDPIMESLRLRQNQVIRIMENQQRWHTVLTTLNVACSLPHFYSYVRGGLNWTDSKGNDYRHILRHWFVKTGFEASWKKWTGFAEIGNGRKQLVGETISQRDKDVYVGLAYKLGKVSLNVLLYLTLDSWTSYDENAGKHASSRRYLFTSNHNMLLLKAVWNFEFGRKYHAKQKRIHNSDTDPGILNAR